MREMRADKNEIELILKDMQRIENLFESFGLNWLNKSSGRHSYDI